MKMAVIIAQLVVCGLLMVIILMQSGKTAGLSGVIGGGSDTYLSKNKARTFDSRLARATKWVAIVFVVLTLAINMII